MKDLAPHEKVAAFHAACDAPIDLPLNHNTVSEMELRRRLILEEMAELEVEMHITLLDQANLNPISNKAELLKEMVDVLYVIYGTAVTFGLPIEEAFQRVHESNMSKLVNGKATKRADGKVLKGPNYQPPTLNDLVNA